MCYFRYLQGLWFERKWCYEVQGFNVTNFVVSFAISNVTLFTGIEIPFQFLCLFLNIGFRITVPCMGTLNKGTLKKFWIYKKCLDESVQPLKVLSWYWSIYLRLCVWQCKGFDKTWTSWMYLVKWVWWRRINKAWFKV